VAEKLLINVTVEETRIALVEGGVLSNLEIDTTQLDEAKGNVYKGIVHRVNPSLQAAFVDYGEDKQGFLPLSEIHSRYHPANPGNKKLTISDLLHERQELMVQVVKDEIGNKGASLSTFVSLPGRYLVIMPDSGKTGISRRLPGDERKRLKDLIDDLPVPEGFGVIIRTAGVEREKSDVARDLDYLKRLWTNLEERFAAAKGPGLIHRERSAAMRFIRDYATGSLDEIMVDDVDTYEEIRDYCAVLVPEMKSRIRFYDDPTPLFSRYQIEDQIDDVFARRIDLPSGGSIVIDQTEALVAIDVNSGRVKTDDIEQTALTTNLEAAAEVARQLRLRDRGGLVVVDFIDMRDRENIKTVEQAARDAFASDKAKVKFSRISEFGLMEISRQRLKSALMMSSFHACESCGGTGLVRSVESSALYLLRRLKETVLRGTNYVHVSAKMPVDVANYLVNRKRRDLSELERESNVTLDVRGIPECPPNQAFVEILASAGRGKRARRLLLTFDLVRSDVERRELDEMEEVLIEAAEARGLSLTEDEYDTLYRTIEKKMADDLEIVEAQRQSQEDQARTRSERDRQTIAREDAERQARDERAAKQAREVAIAAAAAAVAAVPMERSGGIVGWFKRILFGDKKPVPTLPIEVSGSSRLAAARRSPPSERLLDHNDPLARRKRRAARGEAPKPIVQASASPRKRAERDDEEEAPRPPRVRPEAPKAPTSPAPAPVAAAMVAPSAAQSAADDGGGDSQSKRKRRRRRRRNGGGEGDGDGESNGDGRADQDGDDGPEGAVAADGDDGGRGRAARRQRGEARDGGDGESGRAPRERRSRANRERRDGDDVATAETAPSAASERAELAAGPSTVPIAAKAPTSPSSEPPVSKPLAAPAERGPAKTVDSSSDAAGPRPAAYAPSGVVSSAALTPPAPRATSAPASAAPLSRPVSAAPAAAPAAPEPTPAPRPPAVTPLSSPAPTSAADPGAAALPRAGSVIDLRAAGGTGPRPAAPPAPASRPVAAPRPTAPAAPATPAAPPGPPTHEE
jgi:ribonuclease E